MGLMLTLMSGAPLFTGMTALVPAAVFENKAGFGSLTKVWISSFLGNCLGCVMILGLASAAGVPPSPAPASVAAAKTSLPFMKIFTRGIFCNALVCSAIVSFMSANTWGSKFLGVLLPISCFVALGLEHSIASVFMIPWGILQGSSATFGSFLSYMVPATLGNVVGGLFLAVMLGAAYGNMSKVLAPS
jgi:formate/nitrite transporter FocA (FNT family)